MPGISVGFERDVFVRREVKPWPYRLVFVFSAHCRVSRQRRRSHRSDWHDDSTNIDLANILANQIFEASFAQYNISVTDDFDNAGGADCLRSSSSWAAGTVTPV